MASLLGCDIEKVTLTMLASKLSEDKRDEVIEKKAEIKSLIDEFKKEYTSTIILVSECARFNKMLIKSIFNFGKTNSVFYSSQGKLKEHKDSTKSLMVNCDL